jgi:hypothetical protein
MSDTVVGALLGALIGIATVLTWSLSPVVVDLYRHGFDNHDCHRDCCR